MTQNSKFFSNKKCKYFPCHESNLKNFNCLFCFCPLYLLDCEGKFSITEDFRKDCSECFFPHDTNNYKKIIKFLE